MQPDSTITSSRIILPDVSLAAIVRDEMMNPSGKNPPGAIVDFVHSTVPFVEEAVIVDTGSKDGTRQALEELQAQYPQLRVFDRQFDDYASSRNYSLAQVRTRYAFVLDADERIVTADFERLAKIIRNQSGEDYHFDFVDHFIGDNLFGIGHNPRLFLKSGKTYRNKCSGYGEFLLDKESRIISESCDIIPTQIEIHHFKTYPMRMLGKYHGWYQGVVENRRASLVAPSEVPEFQDWKAYNPRREEYR